MARREQLRRVTFAPYGRKGPTFTLTLWDAFHYAQGKNWLTYRLTSQGRTIFEGDDFGASPMHGIDSDEAVKALMGFLTLRPGDTDKEYFNKYTPRQLAFANEHAEHLAYEVMNRFGE